jgi:hypothetical protein
MWKINPLLGIVVLFASPLEMTFVLGSAAGSGVVGAAESFLLPPPPKGTQKSEVVSQPNVGDGVRALIVLRQANSRTNGRRMES